MVATHLSQAASRDIYSQVSTEDLPASTPGSPHAAAAESGPSCGPVGAPPPPARPSHAGFLARAAPQAACLFNTLAMVLALPCYRHACWRTPSSPHKPHCSSEGTSSLVASQPTRLSGPAFILTVPNPTESHFERPVPGPSRRLGLGE